MDRPVDLSPELLALTLEVETGLAGISRIVKDADLAALGTDFPTEDERVKAVDARGLDLVEEVLLSGFEVRAELVCLVEGNVVLEVGVAGLDGLRFGFGSATVLACLLITVEEFNLGTGLVEALTLLVTGSCGMFSTLKQKFNMNQPEQLLGVSIFLNIGNA